METLRVLSLDGGGMRGIYTTAYLHHLVRGLAHRKGDNKATDLDVGKAFQLIVGTSTGAIVGCGLAAGVSLSKMQDLYRDNGRHIFRKRLPTGLAGVIRDLFVRKQALRKGEDALRAALVNALGNQTLGEIWRKRGIALAVPAVNMANWRGWVFKTPHLPDSTHRDDDYRLVDVCLASSAAPLFRSLAAVPTPEHNGTLNVFADGGLWANNPILVALTEALRMSGEAPTKIEVFSLGTCGKPEGEGIDAEARHRGLPEWKFGGLAASLSVSSQEYGHDQVARMLVPFLSRNHYDIKLVRFPSEPVPAWMLPYLDLDETREKALDALVNQAATDANYTNSQIQKNEPAASAILDLVNSMPTRNATGSSIDENQ
jgi:hypothetical protein